VLGDALSRDGELGSERAGRRFPALEQPVEQPQPHWVTERRPQAICVLAFLRYCVPREPVARAA
jgi:hypothetical protein